MIIEIKIPSPGESIAEVEVSSWLVSNGDFVEKDQEIAEIESDKATLPLMAEESGKINILAETGKPIGVGEVACTIDTEATGDQPADDPGASSLPISGKAGREQPEKEEKAAMNNLKDEPVPETGQTGSLPLSGKAGQEQKQGDRGSGPAESSNEGKPAEEEPSSSDKSSGSADSALTDGLNEKTTVDNLGKIKISPIARKLMEDQNLTIEDVIGRLQRITKNDVEAAAGIKDPGSIVKPEKRTVTRDSTRKRMSVLRRKLSTRLVAVKNETAMLTTFNEVDMSRIIDIRKNNQSRFVEKHGIKLGFMSFFAKAVTETLRMYSNINSYIDGDDIITPEYVDIGIAVQTDKGLMVPVMRNTEAMGLAGIEKSLAELAGKARKNRISIEEMSGGTFTITNGGIFGSLLSTPILNPPQSAILGMHNIVERPVAIKGRVEIRPMMYIALSYDHRIIDGRDSVGFLVKIKELIEDPGKMLFEGKDPDDLLLGL